MSSPTPFCLCKSPLNGNGLAAARPIKAGELILAERTLLLATADADSIKSAYEALSQDKKIIYTKLFGQYFDLQENLPVDIFRLSSLALGGGTDSRGIFEVTYRINHSCTPNAQGNWCKKTGYLSIYAMADIPQGTEITGSYIPLYSPRNWRVDDLIKIYHFACKCSTCCSGDNSRSDNRRIRISEIPELLDEAKYRGNCSGALELLAERLRLINEEGLFDLASRCEGNFDGAQVAGACGNVNMTRRYTGLSFAYSLLGVGAEHGNTQRLLELYRNPKQFSQDVVFRKLPVMCDWCGVKASKGRFEGSVKIPEAACKCCKCAIWCSDECKQAHYPYHKAACGVLQCLEAQVWEEELE